MAALLSLDPGDEDRAGARAAALAALSAADEFAVGLVCWRPR